MKIPIQIGFDAIASYRRLAYTPWHAIAELVDNSTQSYFDNQKVLNGLKSGVDRPLVVSIGYKPDDDQLIVSDNAMGMNYSDLENALHIAKPPANPNTRSRYGLGMKTAACWLGDIWKIRTTKYGEEKEYTVVVDVDRIVSGDPDLNCTTKTVAKTDHYTHIEICNMNQIFKGRTLNKIDQYLRSMYRQDFRNEILKLLWRDKELSWPEWDDRLLDDYDGNKYKKNLDFEVTCDKVGKTRISGWVGVLSEGSRSSAGFSIMHSDRVIKGWPDSWHPYEIYGENRNDLINQRLVGEIHLDDFDVSHTKDDILWLGNQEEQVEQALARECAELKNVARTARKNQPDERGASDLFVAAAVAELSKEVNSAEFKDAIDADPMVNEKVVQAMFRSVLDAVVVDGHDARFSARISDLLIRLYVELDFSPNDPYLAIDSARDNEVIVVVNGAHPHWTELENEVATLNYLKHCVYDGVAEWQARKKNAELNPETIKMLKDRLLRLGMEIENKSIHLQADAIHSQN